MDSIFTKKTIIVDKIQQLKDKSNNALAVFRQTLVSLSDANQEIDVEIDVRVKQIEALEKENSVLNEVKNENDKFIGKINEFLKENKK